MPGVIALCLALSILRAASAFASADASSGSPGPITTALPGDSALGSPGPDPSPSNPPAPLPQPTQATVQAALHKDPISRSWFPIAGYNPTYRFFAGGGYFFEKLDRFRVGGSALLTQDGVVKVDLRSMARLSERWRLGIAETFANGFESNYGKGSQTSADDRVDVDVVKNEFDVRVAYLVTRQFSFGPLINHRIQHRSSPPVAGEVDPIPHLARGTGFGLHQHLDFRNVDESPNVGWYQNFAVTYVPAAMRPSGSNGFVIAEGDVRIYQNLIADDLVLAYDLAGGVSFGTPGYLYEYRLGGTDRLRGFYDNRFRGSRYYLQQSELRFPIYKMLGGATFLEFGEATSARFNNPRASYGAGLRLGLPPDYLAKIRLDFAYSQDQRGIFFNFGQAF